MASGATAHEILSAIAKKHGVSVDEIKSRTRTDKLVTARIEFVVATVSEWPHLCTRMVGGFINRSPWQVSYYVNRELRERRKVRERWKKRLGHAERIDNGWDGLIRPGLYTGGTGYRIRGAGSDPI